MMGTTIGIVGYPPPTSRRSKGREKTGSRVRAIHNNSYLISISTKLYDVGLTFPKGHYGESTVWYKYDNNMVCDCTIPYHKIGFAAENWLPNAKGVQRIVLRGASPISHIFFVTVEHTTSKSTMTRTLKRRAYAIALQLLLITSLAFVDGSRGFVSRRNGFVAARRLPQDGSVNEAIEETAAHEIAETFTETHEKIPKSSKREDDKESGVVRGGGESYKRKSRKGKLPDRPVAPKTSSTRAPGARLPTPKAMSGQKYPVIKTPKIKDETSMKDPQKPYMGSSKTPKGVKGKKDKAYQDRGKYPKGMKSIKDNEDKTIVPKFPGDDDDYDHYGDYDDGGGMGDDADSTATRAPRVPSTMAPTVPKDGRHDEDDDYYQDDYYYDDEVQNAAEREEEDDDGDDGDDALTDFGKCDKMQVQSLSSFRH